MDSVTVTVPLRPPTKKMKKRKELDALAPPHAVSRRCSGKRSSQELLSESSDERLEYWNVAASRSGSHKVRGRKPSRHSSCQNFLRACSYFLSGTLFLITVVLIWLFLDVRQQITSLRAELDQVIAGSEGVPDALQMCHALDKDFKSNISHINNEILMLNTSLNKLSEQISSFQRKFQEVQVSLKSAPELTSVPNTVKALQNSIGQLEIDINDLKTTYNMVKTSTLSLESWQNKQREHLINLENSLKDLSSRNQKYEVVPSNETLIETKKLWSAIDQLSKNVTLVNETLTINITWVKEDWANDHKKVISHEDMVQKMNAQILTLQQECARRKNLGILEKLIDSLSNKVNKLDSDSISNDSMKNVSKTNQERPQGTKKIIDPKSSDTVLKSLPIDEESHIITTETKLNKLLKSTQKVEDSGITRPLLSTRKTPVAREVLPDVPSTTTKSKYTINISEKNDSLNYT